MPVQIVYPLTYKDSSHFNNANGHILLSAQKPLTPSGYVITEVQNNANFGQQLQTSLRAIDEGTASPDDTDALEIVGYIQGTTFYTDPYGISLQDLTNTNLIPYSTKLKFEYSDLLVNPTKLTLRIRTDVSGLNAMVGAECYNDQSLIGLSTLYAVPSGKRTTEINIPVSLSSTQAFRPKVNLIFGASGAYGNGSTTYNAVGYNGAGIRILASELEASGTSAFGITSIPITTYGGIENCSPTFTIIDRDNEYEIDGQVEYLDWQRIRVLSSGTRFQDTLMNSFGTTWESGGTLGSHFYLKEGSGKYLRSHDNRYSGEVVSFIGGTIDPIWMFDNKKIAGQKINIDDNDVSFALPHLTVIETTIAENIEPTPPSFTITFYETVGEVPSEGPSAIANGDGALNNNGGNTAFVFYAPSPNYTFGWDMSASQFGGPISVPNPNTPTIDLNGDLTGLANAIVACFNDVAPWDTDNITVASVGYRTMTFSVTYAVNLPTNVTGGADYAHFTPGAEYGGYFDDFTVDYDGGTAGGPGDLSTRYRWANAPTNGSNYKNLFHNGNCLRLGVYAYSGIPVFNEDGGTLNPASGVHLSTFKKLPDGPFGVTLLYNDLSTNYQYLNNFDKVYGSGFLCSATFGAVGDIVVSHVGTADTYPFFTQTMTLKLADGSASGLSRTYNYINRSERFTGNLLTYSGGIASLYNISDYGCTKVLESSSFSRFPTSSNFEYKPNRMVGLRELIISSGSHPSAAQIDSYLFNNVNYLPNSNVVGNYTQASPHICHKGPNSVGAIYSGDISYLVGDGYKLGVPREFYSMSSGTTLKLDLIVQYSGDGDCYLNPWIETNNYGEQYTWTPCFSGDGLQPSIANRGLRVLPGSGIHKISYSGPHKSNYDGAITDSRLFINTTYAQKPTPYSGGELNIFSAKLYTDEAVCYPIYPSSGSFTLYSAGLGVQDSGIDLFIHGHTSVSSGMPLAVINNFIQSGLPLFLCNAITTVSGMPLFTYNGMASESLPLTVYNTVTSGYLPLFTMSSVSNASGGVPLSIYSTSNSGVQSNLDLYLMSENQNANLPLIVYNSTLDSGPSSDIPLVTWNDSTTRGFLPLYLESVRESGGMLRLYTAGAGVSLGAYVERSGIPLYIARGNDSVDARMNFYICGPTSLSGEPLLLTINGGVESLLDDVDNAFGVSMLGFPLGSGVYDSITNSTQSLPMFIHGF